MAATPRPARRSAMLAGLIATLAFGPLAQATAARPAASRAKPRTYYLVVHGAPAPGQEDGYNRWYDTRHLPDMLALPGVVSAQRFVLTPDQDRAFDAKSRKYMVIFKIRTADLKGVFQELERRSKAKMLVMSPAFDGTTVTSAAFQPIGPEILAGREGGARAAALKAR